MLARAINTAPTRAGAEVLVRDLLAAYPQHYYAVREDNEQEMHWSIWSQVTELCNQHSLAFGLSYHSQLKQWRVTYYRAEDLQDEKCVVGMLGDSPIRAAIDATKQLKLILAQE